MGEKHAHQHGGTDVYDECCRPFVERPEVIVAKALKRLYPQNPDIVLGREARTIVAYLDSAGYALTRRED